MKNNLRFIFIFLFISILCHCATGTRTVREEKPEKKETAKPEKKDEKLRPLMLSEEALLGKAVSMKLIAFYGLIGDKNTAAYINSIGQTLALASDRPDTYSGYLFAVLDSDELFTLSAPDGFIFISKGLLKKCRNEDELAFLLAKEISHIVWNDPVNSIEKPVIHEINKAFREKKSGLPDREALKNAFSLLLDSVSKNLQNGFPEEINVRAFKMAIDILIKTGYSVKAAVSILNQIDFDSQYAKMNSDLEKIKAENNVIIIKLAASSVKIIDTARSNRFLAFKKKLQ